MNGFCYVITDPQAKSPWRIKIGFSESPWDRLKALQSGNPRLEMFMFFPGTRKNEARFHRYMKRQSVGREWFELRERSLRRFSDAFTPCLVLAHILEQECFICDAVRPRFTQFVTEVAQDYVRELNGEATDQHGEAPIQGAN